MASCENKAVLLSSGLLSASMVCGGLLLPAVANAGGGLIGPQPYNFPARSGQAALILYESKQASSGNGSGGGATIYNNTTISATNWQQIEMTLGDGSEASMVTDSSQNADSSEASSSSEFFNTLEEELLE